MSTLPSRRLLQHHPKSVSHHQCHEQIEDRLCRQNQIGKSSQERMMQTGYLVCVFIILFLRLGEEGTIFILVVLKLYLLKVLWAGFYSMHWNGLHEKCFFNICLPEIFLFSYCFNIARRMDVSGFLPHETKMNLNPKMYIFSWERFTEVWIHFI